MTTAGRDPAVTIALHGRRGGPGPWRHLTGWVRAHPGLAVALVVPVVVFGAPQLFGGTYLTGDNFIQNLPMRALVGTDIDHGAWPLWNPYLFSGTPLLGGFNAGAAYPATWLTAVLPLFTAWTLTLVVAYDLALVGMYVFLRRQLLSVTAATFGAVTFAFAGYMTGQLVHIDLIEGAAWLPWILVSVHALTGGARPRPPGDGRTDRGRTRRWALVLALSTGMSLLSGNAEGIIDGAVLVAIYLVGRLITTGLLKRAVRRDLARSLAGLVGGLVGGAALGAAQWLPGLVFLTQSQRAVTSYSYFASGSLDARLLVLLASPFAVGTDQNVPSAYAGTYNFPEVTSYMGILALIAACSLFLKRWRGRPESRHWWIWYVILVVGVLSALGSETPFSHLMYAIPGIRNERLLNRNILLVDFSLAVLVGWWVHVLVAERADRPPVRTTLASRWRQSASEVVTTCIPVAAMAAVCILLWADGSQLERDLLIQIPIDTFHRVRVALLVTAQLAVAGWATWTVLVERRFTTRRLTGLLAAVLVADLVLFNVFVVQPPISEATAQAVGPSSAALRSLTGDGRFIIYDPDEFYPTELLALGQTDLNIYGRLPSAQGYTALTDDNYYQATGTHYQEDLDPETLAGPTWDDLNVTTLLSLPGYFVTPVPPDPGSRSTPPTILFPGDLSTYRLTPDPVPDRFTLAPGASRPWYFGGVLTLRSWTLPVVGGSASSLRIGLVTPTGGRQWLPATDARVVGQGGHGLLRVTLGGPGAGRRRRGGGGLSDPGGGRDPRGGDRPDRGGGSRRPHAVRGHRPPLAVHRDARLVRRVPQCQPAGLGPSPGRGGPSRPGRELGDGGDHRPGRPHPDLRPHHRVGGAGPQRVVEPGLACHHPARRPSRGPRRARSDHQGRGHQVGGAPAGGPADRRRLPGDLRLRPDRRLRRSGRVRGRRGRPGPGRPGRTGDQRPATTPGPDPAAGAGG